MLASGSLDCWAHTQRFSNMLDDMYVARDKNGSLWLYSENPHREEACGVWYSGCVNIMKLNRKEFPELKWEDELIKVKLIKQS